MGKFSKGVLLILLVALSGCYYFKSPQVPMSRLFYPAEADYVYQPQWQRSAPDLLVLLPGINGSAEQFEHEGLIDQVRESHLPVDVLVADAHFGYYRERSFLIRLEEDVLAPARAAGYRRIYLAGISLGGFGALLQWRHGEGESIDALLLLTPYLGEPEYYAHKLDPSLQPQALDEDKNLWPWLATVPPRKRQHWYLGRAEEDRFYIPNGLLMNTLPPANGVTLAGGHNWPTWRRLWPELLMRLKRDFYGEAQSE